MDYEEVVTFGQGAAYDVLILSIFVFVLDNFSPCSPRCPQIHNPPGSEFWLLGLEVYTMIPHVPFTS